MVRSSSLETAQLSQIFFGRLLESISALLGPELITRFEELKRQRERFLREQWSGGDSEESDPIFREVDYEYLVTAIRRQETISLEAQADVQIELAKICYQFGELQKSIDLLTHVRQHTLDDQSSQQGVVYELLGKVETHRNNWDRARHWLTQALHLYEEAQNIEGMVSAHMHLGILTAQRWNIPSALDHLEQGRSLMNQGSVDDSLEFKIDSNRAIIEGMLGKSKEAADRFQQLLDQEFGKHPQYSIQLQINLGTAIKEQGDLAAAEPILEEALDAAQALPHTRLIAQGAAALAEVRILQGKHDTGQRHLITAFKIFSQLHDRASLADIYRTFGILHRETGYPDLAAAKFDISLEMNREYGNLLNLLDTHYDYSLLAGKENEPEKQKYHLEKALAYAEKMGAIPRIEKLRKELNSLK